VTKYLIVNADDLGISVPVNQAVRRASRSGIVTSASLLANMPAFRHAVEEVIRPDPRLGVGVHLCLTSGRPVLTPEKVPLLADPAGGRFRHGFLGIWRLVCSRRREEALRQIGQELAAQVERVESCGIRPDHLNGHQHVHTIPGVFDLVARLAQTRKIAVRMASEPFRLGQHPTRLLECLVNGGVLKNLVLTCFAMVNRRNWPGVLTADHYFGILDTGRMTVRRLRGLLRALPEGVSEVTVHPGLPGDPVFPLDGEDRTRGDRVQPRKLARLDGAGALTDCSGQDRRFLRRRQAAEELAALADPAIWGMLAGRGIRLVRFADIEASHSSGRGVQTARYCAVHGSGIRIPPPNEDRTACRSPRRG